eukprot:38762-Chlamydomonas_euryale.AAC.5
MLARGGLALLPRQLSNILQPGFTASKGLVDVPSPDFASKTAMVCEGGGGGSDAGALVLRSSLSRQQCRRPSWVPNP